MAVIPFHTESEFPHFLPNRVRRDPSQVEIAGIRLLEFAPVTLEQHLSEGVEPVERVIGPAEIASAVYPLRIPWGVEVEERGTASALPRVVYRACHIRVRLQSPAGLHVVARNAVRPWLMVNEHWLEAQPGQFIPTVRFFLDTQIENHRMSPFLLFPK